MSNEIKIPTDLKKRALTEGEAAHYLSVAPSTLRRGRMTGRIDNKFQPPPFVRFGRSVRYLIDDLDAWLGQHRVKNTLGYPA